MSAKTDARKAGRDAEQRRRIDEHIKRIVDAAPPLTSDQRDRLALLLRPKPQEESAPDHTFGSLTASLVDQMEEDE